MNEWTLYLLLFLLGVFPTVIWRVAGLWLSHSLDSTSPIFQWVRAVATATLAAVVAKLAFMPSGALAEVSTPSRALALMAGIAAYLLFRHSVVAGVTAGVGGLIALAAFKPF